jgi:hypothetical protein
MCAFWGPIAAMSDKLKIKPAENVEMNPREI